MCLVTREKKQTLAGNRFKTTGPPRFPDDQDSSTPLVQSIDTEIKVQEILRDVFRMSLSDTQGLNLTKSLSVDPAIWAQF